MEFVKNDTECLGEIQLREKVNSHKKFEGKLKIFKNWPIFAKHSFFATGVSHQQVVRSSRQNTQRKNCEKFSKSFCRDWKVYSRGSRELSRENLCVPLTTGPSTREQVAKIDPRTHDWGPRLDLPATESPKQGKNELLKFSDFKIKILSKNT